MDLYQLLKQDHQKAARLFERIEETWDGAAPARARLFAELKRELELHTEIEEKHFYPALESQDEAKDLIDEALEEHADVKKALAELDRADKDEDGWAARLAELKEDVQHHVEEEEGEIFPLARKLLDQAKVDDITRAIEREKASAPKAG